LNRQNICRKIRDKVWEKSKMGNVYTVGPNKAVVISGNAASITTGIKVLKLSKHMILSGIRDLISRLKLEQ
jgi:hypothetical protein